MPVSTTGTLVRPPRRDPSRSPIENVLQLTRLDDIGPDIFTNTRPLWHPPGARGIYGGSAIAQCLAAAQMTVPDRFFIHSMHCYFVLAGDATIPVLYHVERVRSGRSFATRTVQARQRGRCIFTTTLSFMREGSAGEETVDHESHLPEGVADWLDTEIGAAARNKASSSSNPEEETEENEEDSNDDANPFEAWRMPTLNNEVEEASPAVKRTRQWIRCRGQISAAAGVQGHLSALAYMSDSFFIGTVARVHNLWRFGRPSRSPSTTVAGSDNAKKETTTPPTAQAQVHKTSSEQDNRPSMADLELRENAHTVHERTIGMMVSLDHTIFFHRPHTIRADEWLFAEMESPWAGDGRGLVLQRIWNRRGQLVASCVQEGLVRLVQRREKVKL